MSRTPEARLASLPDYPFTPRYAEIDAGDDACTRLRVHYVEEPRPVIRPRPRSRRLCCCTANRRGAYLYRDVVPSLVAAGHRCLAPDLVGFGQSDKPADRFVYPYQSHVDRLRKAVFDRLDWLQISQGRTIRHRKGRIWANERRGRCGMRRRPQGRVLILYTGSYPSRRATI